MQLHHESRLQFLLLSAYSHEKFSELYYVGMFAAKCDHPTQCIHYLEAYFKRLEKYPLPTNGTPELAGTALTLANTYVKVNNKPLALEWYHRAADLYSQLTIPPKLYSQYCRAHCFLLIS